MMMVAVGGVDYNDADSELMLPAGVMMMMMMMIYDCGGGEI